MPQSDTSLIDRLKSLAQKVGFIESQALLQSLGVVAPESCLVMHNKYAILVGYEVPEAESDDVIISQLESSKAAIAEWMRETLILLEDTKGLLIDGYIVFTLKENATEGLKEMTRNIELDTSICRKHVAWPVNAPEGEPPIDMLQFVTALGLPESPSVLARIDGNIVLCDEAAFALKKYEELGKLDAVIDAIKAQIDANK